jgi:hypothetical protein
MQINVSSAPKVPANSDKPLLLVDVDGVISLFGDGLDARTAGSWVMVDGLVHFLSQAAGDHLRELAPDFELAWCTGWEERANEHLPQLLSLPSPLPVVTFGRRPQDGAHWKLAGIDRHAGAERPVAWIDDAHSADCHAWADRRPAPTLLVATDAARGLTAVEAERLRAWAAALRAGTAAR